jgi:hypothetical protein
MIKPRLHPLRVEPGKKEKRVIDATQKQTMLKKRLEMQVEMMDGRKEKERKK